MDYFEWTDLTVEECARFWAEEPEGIKDIFAGIASMSSKPRVHCASLIAEVSLAFCRHGLGFRWVKYAVAQMTDIVEEAEAEESGYE